MNDALLDAWTEFKVRLIAEKGRAGAADLLEFAAAWMRAEAEHERGNVVEFRKRSGDAA